MEREKSVGINFHISKELKRKSEIKAKELSISRNSVMRMALAEFLKDVKED